MMFPLVSREEDKERTQKSLIFLFGSYIKNVGKGGMLCGGGWGEWRWVGSLEGDKVNSFLWGVLVLGGSLACSELLLVEEL